MKFFMSFAFLVSFISVGYSQEIALIVKPENERSFFVSNIFAAELISKSGNKLTYRKLAHPSRMGGSTVDASGNQVYGLVNVSAEQVIKSTSKPGVDKNKSIIKVGSTLHARIHVGRRSKYVDGYVLRNFTNGTSLISFDPAFVSLAQNAGISEAIRQLNYSSLKVVVQSQSVLAP